MNARNARIYIGALVLVAAGPLNAGEWLAMKVSPLQSIAPTNMSIRFRIEPHAENRMLEISLDSDDFYRSSQIPLDGDRAPRTITLSFLNLPGGRYQVSGILANDAGHERAMVRQNVRVIPSPAGGR